MPTRPRKPKALKPSAGGVPAGVPTAVHEITSPSRSIKRSVELILWGRAAGRCEFDGCNKPLWKSSVTQEPVNIAEKAHVYAFSPGGPRGHQGLSDKELNTVGNLMLVCGECHVKIDHDPTKYTAASLLGMKTRHERRIEIVTGIHPSRRSHVLLYGANIGEHSSPLVHHETASAMFPNRYPAEATPISLGTVDSSSHDRNDEYWGHEAAHLRTRFDQRVRERVARGDIDHLSVFALAPQPLLVLLGTLLGDIIPADVYQRHREPPTWAWPPAAATPPFDSSRTCHDRSVLPLSSWR